MKVTVLCLLALWAASCQAQRQFLPPGQTGGGGDGNSLGRSSAGGGGGGPGLGRSFQRPDPAPQAVAPAFVPPPQSRQQQVTQPTQNILTPGAGPTTQPQLQPQPRPQPEPRPQPVPQQQQGLLNLGGGDNTESGGGGGGRDRAVRDRRDRGDSQPQQQQQPQLSSGSSPQQPQLSSGSSPQQPQLSSGSSPQQQNKAQDQKVEQQQQDKVEQQQQQQQDKAQQDKAQQGQPQQDKAQQDKAQQDKAQQDKAQQGQPQQDKAQQGQPQQDKAQQDKAQQGQPQQGQPQQGQPQQGKAQKDQPGGSRPTERPSLGRFTGNVGQYKNIGQKDIVTQGEAATLKRDIQGNNPRASAEALANAYSGGRGDAAARAVAAAAAGGGSAVAVGRAVAETSRVRPNAAPFLLRQSADFAVNNGRVLGFSRAISQSFAYAQQQNFLGSFVNAFANAILGGGLQTRYAFGSALAYGFTDNRAAVAEATATALCTGGSTAQAWAEAYAIAIDQNNQGCTVLREAFATAYARCGPGYAVSWARSEATSTVIGYCAANDNWSWGPWSNLLGK